MKKILFFIFFYLPVCLYMIGYANDTKTDSLEKLLLQKVNNDSIRVVLLLKLADEYLGESNNQLSLEYSKEAFDIADKIEFVYGKVRSLQLMGNYYKIIKGNYIKAIEFYRRSLETSEEYGYKIGISNGLNYLAIIYVDQGNYVEGMKYYLKCLDINEEIKDKHEISKTLNNIGTIHVKLENYDEAIDCFRETLKISEELKIKRGIAIALTNIGEIYKIQNYLPVALEYLEKSLAINNEIGNSEAIANCYNSIGEIYLLQENNNKAVEYFKIALKIVQESNIKSFYPSTSYYNLGTYYFKTKDFDKAIQNTKKSLDIAKEIKVFHHQRKAYSQLAYIYADIHDYQSAFENYVKFKELNDSIINIGKIQKITSLKLQYEFEKEQQLIEHEQQKKDAIAKKDLEYQRTLKYIFLGGFFAALLIVLMYVRLTIQKKRTNILLMKRNKEMGLQKDRISKQKEEIEAQANELAEHKQHLELKVKKRTTEFVIAKEKAEESSRLKTEFIRNMSHEIRTPMNAILGFSSFIDQPNLPEAERKQYTNIIRNSGEQLLGIIEDILEISHIGSKQAKLDYTAVDINKMCLSIISDLKIKAAEKGLKINVKTDIPEKESIVRTDEAKLSRIVKKLIENAIKFTNEGYIEIESQLTHGKLEIYIKDSGIGISPENHKTIFKRFSQEVKDLSRNYGGLGLGLSIAREYAELLGGSIALSSEKGKGSTFHVTVPTDFSKVEIAPNSKSKVMINSKQKQFKLSVLIVEDEMTNFKYLEILLLNILKLECNIVHAKHGKEAIDFIKGNAKPDIVLMDIKMPVMDGYEATREIRKIYPLLPIIAQTAYTTTEDKQKAIKSGCDAFISKPISTKELSETISKYLGIAG